MCVAKAGNKDWREPVQEMGGGGEGGEKERGDYPGKDQDDEEAAQQREMER